MEKKSVIISEGARPFWQLIVGALFFTLAGLFLIMFFTGYELLPKQGNPERWDFKTLILFYACTLQGVLFAGVKNVLLDLKNMKYKMQLQVGPIKTGYWKKLPTIDYVSVFKQPRKDKSEIFKTNLWYSKNKHLTIYTSFNQEAAFKMGEAIARALKVELLDATISNNYKWVDITG